LRRERRTYASDDESDDWLVTYADAITLLIAFFVMLILFSKIDLPMFEEAAAGISKEVGKRDDSSPPIFSLLNNLNSIVEDAAISTEDVELSFDDQGVVIEFSSRSFFKSGAATMLPKAEVLLRDLAFQISQPPYDRYFVDIEGHTDDVLISTSRFPSNWELSSVRASAVVRFLIDLSIALERLKSTGYVDKRPKVPHRDIYGEVILENQIKKRRVTIRLHP
jgi:chemotaxis protein MotB